MFGYPQYPEIPEYLTAESMPADRCSFMLPVIAANTCLGTRIRFRDPGVVNNAYLFHNTGVLGGTGYEFQFDVWDTDSNFTWLGGGDYGASFMGVLVAAWYKLAIPLGTVRRDIIVTQWSPNATYKIPAQLGLTPSTFTYTIDGAKMFNPYGTTKTTVDTFTLDALPVRGTDLSARTFNPYTSVPYIGLAP